MRHRRSGGEPARAEAADPQAGLRAVAGSRRDHGAVRYAMGRIHDGLARNHGVVQEELRGLGDEVQGLVDVGLRHGVATVLQCRQGHGQGHEEQRGGRGVAAVHFVAHQQGLRLDRLEVDASGLVEVVTHRSLEHRAQHGLEPLQSLQDVRAVGTEAQAAADALVDVGVGHVAVRGVAHLQQRHRRADDARHRSHGLEVMALGELDFPLLEHPLCLLGRARPALVEHGADHRAMHGAAHVGPGHGGAGVKQQPVALQLGEDTIGAKRHVFPHRARIDDAARDFLVGCGDAVITHQSRQLPGQHGVGVARRLPAQGVNATAVGGDAVVEAIDAHVQHDGGLLQQGVGAQAHDWGVVKGEDSGCCSARSTPASKSAPELAPTASSERTALATGSG